MPLAWLKRSICAVIILGALHAQAEPAHESAIIYPRAQTATDTRSAYPIALLRHAITQTGNTHTLKPSAEDMQQGRAFRLLGEGRGIDIVWSMTSREREKNYLPIRIPIFKGLIGWRLLLIRANDQAAFSALASLAPLKKMTAGQGHDWPDTTILIKNGFNVSGVSDYTSLFKMLKQGRIDYFPRSIIEIWDEVKSDGANGLAVEQSIVLRYPTAYYYFVHKTNVALAKIIEEGLEKSLADGSFDALFRQYNQDAIQRARLNERIIYELPNPELPAETPLRRKELWFHTEMLATEK